MKFVTNDAFYHGYMLVVVTLSVQLGHRDAKESIVLRTDVFTLNAVLFLVNAAIQIF